MDALIKLWPILAAICGVGAAGMGWSFTMLWRIAQGVQDVQGMLKQHDECLCEHKYLLGELGTKLQDHEVQLATLKAIKR